MQKIKNLVIALLMIIAAGLGGAKAYIDHRLGIELDKSINSVTDKAIIEYTQVSTSLLGSVIINNLQLIAPDYAPVHIDTITLYSAYQFYDPNSLPQHISIAVEDIHIPISDTAHEPPVLMSAFGYAPYFLSPRELRGLGYTGINADMYFQAKLINNNKFALSVRVNAKAWGNLMFSADLINVPAPASLPKAASQIQLAALALTYIDNGLINQVFNWLAQRHKMTARRFKLLLIAKLKNDISQVPMTLDASVLASLQQFLQSPNQLTISLQPNSPLNINALMTTSPKHLGLKMTTLERIQE